MPNDAAGAVGARRSISGIAVAVSEEVGGEIQTIRKKLVARTNAAIASTGSVMVRARLLACAGGRHGPTPSGWGEAPGLGTDLFGLGMRLGPSFGGHNVAASSVEGGVRVPGDDAILDWVGGIVKVGTER